ncbi:Tetratricopeptide repeat protein 7B [Ancistrocladus abbreviatus]
MRNENSVKKQQRERFSQKFQTIMKCFCSGEPVKVNEMVPFSESLGEVQQKPDSGNIEEAESSLLDSGSLNFEEGRALLGRIEYLKGNIEGALHVLEGIDINAVTPKIKLTLSRRCCRRSSRSNDTPMKMNEVALILEAFLLKAKSLQALGKFKEAAQSCKVILDIVESSLPDGLPVNFDAGCKLQETLIKAVELLPELWKQADCPQEAILSYRRAVLHCWNLDAEMTAKIQKEFAIYLLYSGSEAVLPDLRSQMDTSFVPKNNLEEGILLLMILLRKINLNIIKWDPSILDHLSFALSVSGQPRALASLVEELLPQFIDCKEMYYILALCYDGDGDSLTALDLLRKLLAAREDPNHVPALLMASRICGRNFNFAEEGSGYARRVLEKMEDGCDQMSGVANCLLGMSLAEYAKSAPADSERVTKECEAIQAMERAGKLTKLKDASIVYYLSLEYAEQRKLDVALYYAKLLLKLEGGANHRGWLLLARILSAQKRFVDAEIIIDAAIDETGQWDQGELLRTKSKLQIAQGHLGNAIKTYVRLLAVLQVQRKSFGSGKNLFKGNRKHIRHLECETWHDLANIYISLSQWDDVQKCLSESKATDSHSASRWHVIGLLNEAKGLHVKALEAYTVALGANPTHVPSLISYAVVLRWLSPQSYPIIRSFLMDALQHDRMNHSAWYNLGLLYKAKGAASASEAAECFQAAAFLEESAPVEPFR